MSTVFSVTPSRNVHDINLKTGKGRDFIIDIYQGNADIYDSTVTVLDNVSNTKGSWCYDTTPATSSANDNFKAAVELIQQYLSSVDENDSIAGIYNPCNCPFVSEEDQNMIVSSLDVSVTVRVN
jgi:hypothetical protein